MNGGLLFRPGRRNLNPGEDQLATKRTTMERTDETTERYLQLENLEAQWRWLARRGGGEWHDVGRSVEGRTIPSISFGDSRHPAVLLSALMHGIELIGGLALLAVARDLVARSRERWPLHFVFMPIVNPDAVASNLRRVRAKRRASMRANARGVDLNRNFAILNDRMPLHPFAGSKWPRSYHYMGPRPFSEPETKAVADVARTHKPALSIAFHSFGNMLLYPWAHTAAPNTRDPEYRRLGEAFCGALPTEPYDFRQARGLYPTIGDMDDWLDAELGTLAYTVELGRLDWSVLAPRRFFNPFFWMNPEDPSLSVSNVLPGIAAMFDLFSRRDQDRSISRSPRNRLHIVPQAAR